MSSPANNDPARQPLNTGNGSGSYNVNPPDYPGPPEVQIEMADVVDPKLKANAMKASSRNNLDIEPNGPLVGGIEAISSTDLRKLAKEAAMSRDPAKDGDEISNFNQDVDDLDRFDEAWDEANILEKGVLGLQNAIKQGFNFLSRITRGHFWTLVFLVSFVVYFIVAMTHEFGDEGSHRLLAFTLLGIFIWAFPHIKRFVVSMSKNAYGGEELSIEHQELWRKTKIVIRWFMYAVMFGVMLYVCIDEGKDKPRNLWSLLGLFVFCLISFLFSTKPSKIDWHTIFWSLALQFSLACVVLKWKFGQKSMVWLQSRVQEFFVNAETGSEMVFGEGYREHLVIFGGVPVLMFTNSIFTLLYYLGVMQFIIRLIGKTLKFFLNGSAVETMAVSATIFLEGVATMLILRPFLHKLSKSELFTVINGAMASLGGGYIAILSAAFGISLEYLIPAMVISAPATFAICKLMVPETREFTDEDTENAAQLCGDEKSKYLNAVDAAQTGALSMVSVLANMVVVMFTFITYMAWVNHTLGWLGDRVGIRGLSIELISSYVLYPVSLAMGVDPDDCRRVAMLLGYRLGVYNLVAFLEMTKMKVNRFKYLQYMAQTNFTGTITEHRDDITLDAWNMTLTNGFISERSEAIATYALSGFSSGMSAALLMGVLYTIVPHRKRWIARWAIPSIVAGNLANCMTGCFASMFY